MFGKLQNILIKHKDIIIYIFLGVLTTAVSYGVYFPLYNWSGLAAAVCNVISWVGAVIFAFLTNKPFVFHSHDWTGRTVAAEFLKFVGARSASLLIETAFLFVFVDILCFDGNVMKIAVSIVVVVLNYLFSKLLVFRNK